MKKHLTRWARGSAKSGRSTPNQGRARMKRGNCVQPKALSAALMKGVLVATLILAPLALQASQSEEGRLREIVSELRAESVAIAAESETVKAQLEAAEFQRTSLQRQINEDAARWQAAVDARDTAAAKLRVSLKDAVAGQEQALADKHWWMWRCLGLVVIGVVFLGFKVLPLVMKFVPLVGL